MQQMVMIGARIDVVCVDIAEHDGTDGTEHVCKFITSSSTVQQLGLAAYVHFSSTATKWSEFICLDPELGTSTACCIDADLFSTHTLMSLDRMERILLTE